MKPIYIVVIRDDERSKIIGAFTDEHEAKEAADEADKNTNSNMWVNIEVWRGKELVRN